MCRFLTYSGTPVLLADLLYRPENSLVSQSHASREYEGPLNADGFGVGWYVPEISSQPAVFRSVLPAWSSANLRSLSALTRAGQVFAHVRDASAGMEVSESNCHPFSFGEFLWMHNGTVGGHQEFREWARHALSPAAFGRIRGTTDSELLFALFLDAWESAGRRPGSSALLDGLRRTIHRTLETLSGLGIQEPTTLNLAVTDGRTAVASRAGARGEGPPYSLYVARGRRLVMDRDGCRFEESPGEKCTLVASERLFADPAWEEVPASSLVVVEADAGADLLPV